MKKYLACADQINLKKDSVGSGIFELADKCVEGANEAKTAEEKEEFFGRLNMNKYDFSKYVTVGENKFLPKYRPSVPFHLSILYPLARLKEEELKAGIAEGVINARATRQEIEAWISLRKGKSQVANDNESVLRYKRPSDITNEDEEKLGRELAEVLTRYRCTLSGAQSQLAAATMKARLEYFRSNTRSVIAAEKLRREKEQRLKPRAQRTKAWPFSPEQVKIGSDSTPKDFQRILELIGCTDEWQKILDDAARLYGVVAESQPTPPKKASPRKKAA